MREITKKMFVLNNPRRIIQKVRKDCSKCRMIIKQNVELEMAEHPSARTVIAPPFFNCMMDIAYGFPAQPYKNARKRVHCYALVIVCVLTGATAIFALEGIESQDIVHALERHSARSGVPAKIFVDNGTQLKAMKHAKFSVRDIHPKCLHHLE